MRRFSPIVHPVSAGLLAIGSFLTGCTLQTTSVPNPVAGTAISGIVHGGQQPIGGAKVYLLAVNPTGYGAPGIAPSTSNASISLLNPGSTNNPADSIGSYVLTNSTTGGFSISGDYSCTSGFVQSTATPVALSGTEQVYLYVLGGKPENTAIAPNSASGMLLALGSCNSPTLQVTVNEVTTVAAAYAFAGFASDATHIGSSGSSLALTNLNNAFANVANLANTATGQATPNSATTLSPVGTIYTIANILAACVNSTSTGSSCSTLFSYTASSGVTGISPSDTATAAINLAHNPWPTATGVTALYGLIPGIGAPFPGGLTSQPNDYTLGIRFSGGGMDYPISLAIDAIGDIWVVNLSATGVLSEFSSSGTPLSPATGFSEGSGITNADPLELAIDLHGNTWLTDQQQNSLVEFSSSGNVVATYTAESMYQPSVVAIDSQENVWVGGNHFNLIKFSSSGSILSGTSGFSGGGLLYPQGLAIDTGGNAWVTSIPGLITTRSASLVEFSNAGNPISPSTGFIGGGLTQPDGLAISMTGDIWTGNYPASLSRFSSGGSPISPSTGYTPGGKGAYIYGLAIDGAGNVWTCSNNPDYVSVFSGAGISISPSSGYSASETIALPSSPAIDGSGNVWITNRQTNSITEIVGAAAPVVTPIAANLVSPYGKSTINLP